MTNCGNDGSRSTGAKMPVRFRPRLIHTSHKAIVGKNGRIAAALPKGGEHPRVAQAAEDSNCKPQPSRRITQSGVIPRGPLTGLPKRRATDRTRALNLHHVRHLTNAHAFARCIGKPFNAKLTIAWMLTSRFTEEGWASIQTKVLDETTKWLRRQGIRTAYAWVRERAAGRGPHTHIALHLGKTPFRIKSALRNHLNQKYDFSRAGLHLSMGKTGSHTEAMQAGILLYLLKGFDHAAFRYNGTKTENIGVRLGIDHRGQQGTVVIKRAGSSQNVGMSARKKAGWKENRDLDALHRILHPTHDKVRETLKTPRDAQPF